MIRPHASRASRTWRHWPNTLAGWFIGYGLLTLVVSLDPLGLYSKWEDGLEGVNPFNVGFIAMMFCISITSFVVFARPRIEGTVDALIVRNIRHDVSIPWAALEAFDSDSGLYLKVKAAGKWHRAWGAEKTNAAVFAGAAGHAGRAADAMSALRPSVPVQAEPRTSPIVEPRKPELPEVALIVLWATYVIIGTAFWYGA